MILKVNGSPIDITLEDEKTVGDVLKSFESEVAKEEATTINIILNGTTVTAQTFDSILDTPLAEDTELDLEVLSRAELEASLAEYGDAFTRLNGELAGISVLLQSGKDSEAAGIISRLAESISGFIHAFSYARLFPATYEKIRIDESSPDAFFCEFKPILEDLGNALETKDTVTVGDLSEYEISPRLEKLTQALEVFKA